MSREFDPKGISISTGIAKCANHCRYCQLAYRRPQHFSVERFAKFVEKFAAYREKNGFGVSTWLGYSFDLNARDFARQIELYNKVNNWELKVLLLGGLPLMDKKQTEVWYTERKALGSDSVVASYYGFRQRHDYLNNKEGHFDFQLQAQKIAAGMGLNNIQRVFLLKSALPEMDRLLDELESIDAVTDRIAYLLFYSGLGRNFENERLTRELFENQSERLQAIFRGDHDNWKTEREWVEWVRNGNEPKGDAWLGLNVTDENISRYEAMDCEEIIAELTGRTKAAYDAVPTREELAENYGDNTSEKLYMFMWDMECLWLDRFLTQHPEVNFERELTHFGR